MHPVLVEPWLLHLLIVLEPVRPQRLNRFPPLLILFVSFEYTLLMCLSQFQISRQYLRALSSESLFGLLCLRIKRVVTLSVLQSHCIGLCNGQLCFLRRRLLTLELLKFLKQEILFLVEIDTGYVLMRRNVILGVVNADGLQPHRRNRGNLLHIVLTRLDLVRACQVVDANPKVIGRRNVDKLGLRFLEKTRLARANILICRVTVGGALLDLDVFKHSGDLRLDLHHLAALTTTSSYSRLGSRLLLLVLNLVVALSTKNRAPCD